MSVAGAVLLAVVAAALAGVVTALFVRRPDGAAEQASALAAVEGLAQGIGRLQDDLGRLGRTQDELRQDVQQGRETSLLRLADMAQGLRGELGQAHRALAEVKALEQARVRQMDQAAESLRRLEAVVAGSSSRGAAGENILARALAQLPPDLLEVNAAFGNKVVEYALRLPGGRLLPIDSKWTSVAPLDRLERLEEVEVQEKRRLLDQVVRDVRGRIRDMSKYLEPDRTLGLGLLAVPDAVYSAAPEAHGEGYRLGVVVVPYSLALPYVLALYRLTLRLGCAVDTDQLADHVRTLGETLRRIDEEVEGRLSRGLVQVENARDALRERLRDARRVTTRLLEAAESEGEEEPPRPAPSAPLTLPFTVARD
jgi:DNA recombination protein RmuC